MAQCAATKRSVIIAFDHLQNPIATLPSHVDYLRNGRTDVVINLLRVISPTDLDVIALVKPLLHISALITVSTSKNAPSRRKSCSTHG